MTDSTHAEDGLGVVREDDYFGVGLHDSREIMRLHGGRTWFDSPDGGGTSFHFSFPLEVRNDTA